MSEKTENLPSYYISGRELASQTKEVISIGPCLDVITHGIPFGSIVTLTGDPKAGKTNVSLNIARNAQKFGSKVYYFNIEARLKPRDLLGIDGLDLDNFLIIGSYYKNKKPVILSAEDYLNEAEKIIHNEPRSVIIFDSISQLITKKELASELGDSGYAPGPALMASFLKRVSNIISINDIIAICILHYTTNMNPATRKTKQKSGGRKVVYAADIDLEAKYFKIIKNSDGYPVGQEVVWQTLSTAFLPPGQEITSLIRYNVGIDEIGEWIKLGVDLGLITQNGPYYSVNIGDEVVKAQGKEKLRTMLEKDKSLLDNLSSNIRKMVFPL